MSGRGPGSLRSSQREPARLPGFAVISRFGWLLDLGVMIGLVGSGTGPFWANLAGATCGVGFVFVLSQRRIFTEIGGGRVRWRPLLPCLFWHSVAIPSASALVALAAQLAAWPAAVAAAQLPGLFTPEVLAAGAGKIAVTPLTLYANFLVSGWFFDRRVSAW